MKLLRICLIASSRFPVAEPFAGGLEAHTHSLALALRARGHAVTLFAAAGSDARLDARILPVEAFQASSQARQDVAAPPAQWMQEHHAYLSLCLDLAATGVEQFDVIHNNSLHYLPVAMSSAIRLPMVTTLHTPPTPWLESAMRFARTESQFVSVSDFTARQWKDSVRSTVIKNGVDTSFWKPGPGGGPAIWFGRIVPEKAPHLAIQAALLAGMDLDIAGPIFDHEYYRTEIIPHLGASVRYLGHLDSAALSRLVGEASVTVVTPSWDEPYGLVAAESMALGTPVAAFARGGLTELISAESGRLARPGDVAMLAREMQQAAKLPRARVREHAVVHCSIETMVDAYERFYSRMVDVRSVA